MKQQNRLSKEQSPYLLQHSFNPVDWYPWSDEAFQKAIDEDKPIFLSIGYSTCHWCHVMEKESFEDNEIAELMNRAFISIKVDREERPDIDGVYMSICQMLTGSGGWPLTIIMTPDKKPFFAGTYFPKESRFGRIGMLELIPRISELWNTKRKEINFSADEIASSLSKNILDSNENDIDEKIFDLAFDDLKNRFDEQFGGFGNAPKFPTPHNFFFLLRYWNRTKNSDVLNIIETSLQKMRLGGVYDQIGFGFHRYSTDRQWLVPHFEKMLYDQALLAIAYAETYQVTKNIFYKKTAEEIFSYVLRDMTSYEGAFYSAEDADSEDEEGSFYLWKEEEIKSVLQEDSELFIRIFGIEKNGNWIDHIHEEKKRTNILHLKEELKKTAIELKITSDDLEQKIESAREKLFSYREKRIHPFKDDKILTDWNGLMITALAKAARIFNNQEYLKAAENAMKFILLNLKTKEGQLLHRYRNGIAGINANLDDYSFIIWALIELYESSFKTEYLKEAFQLNEKMIKFFWDNDKGGFFFTNCNSDSILFRQKEIFDGAIPSGNSVAVLNLLKLSKISSNINYTKKTEKLLKIFSQKIRISPSSFTYALLGFEFVIGPSLEIVISFEEMTEELKKILEILNKKLLPNKILILNSHRDKEIKSLAPFVLNKNQIDNKLTIYLCENYQCRKPVTSAKELEKLLNQF